MKRSLLIVTVAVAASMSTTASAAPNFVIRSDNDIGGFKLGHNGTLKSAVDVYGDPTSRLPFGDVCTVVWTAYGISSRFAYAQPGACSDKACHMQTTLTSRQWKTGKGLHIGDTSKRLRKLYPRTRRDVGQNWTLMSRPFAGVRFPTLLATLKGGRVTAFVVRTAGLLTCLS
jgi:hypothetical protein